MVILGSMPLSTGASYRSTSLVGAVSIHLKCLRWGGKALRLMCSGTVLISFWLDTRQPCCLAEYQSWWDAALLKDLKARVENDQEARKKWVADPKNETFARSVDAIDAANLSWLRQLISEKGFPTAAQVGNEGVHLAWILLQHADQDPKLQSQLLPVLEQRFATGELPANDLARITDRVLLASGKLQRYGTQFDWFSEFKLPEPDKLTAIDTARSHVGLMPLSDYVCTIRRAREKLK
jgi:hypothetical protein